MKSLFQDPTTAISKAIASQKKKSSLDKKRKKQSSNGPTSASKKSRSAAGALAPRVLNGKSSQAYVAYLEDAVDDETLEAFDQLSAEQKRGLELKFAAKHGAPVSASAAVKSAKTAYHWFCVDRIDALKEASPDKTKRELKKILSAQWKALSPEEKKPFKEQAKAEKARVKAEAEAAAGGPSVKATKPKKDPNKPKAKTSAWNFFLSEKRKEMKGEQDAFKKIGALWKSMKDQDKVPYQELATKDAERYKNEMKDYIPPKGFEKKKRKAKDKNKPKGARSAFLFYSCEKRPALVLQHPDKSFGEVAKIIGQQWRGMDDEAKKPFQRLADADKLRHSQEVAKMALAEKGIEEPAQSPRVVTPISATEGEDEGDANADACDSSDNDSSDDSAFE